jgi:hypothetical protein
MPCCLIRERWGELAIFAITDKTTIGCGRINVGLVSTALEVIY